MKPIIASAIGLALIVGIAAPVAAQAGRQVRELRADDPNLKPVLFAAVDHIFNEKDGPIIGFNGVFINRRQEPSLTAEVRQRLNAKGLARRETPPGCEALPSRVGPAPPMGVSKDGTPVPPAATGTTKPLSSAICNRGFESSYAFTVFRVAGDSAYVEMEVSGVARSSTKCLSLVVAPEGGWTAVAMKNSKVRQCGK